MWVSESNTPTHVATWKHLKVMAWTCNYCADRATWLAFFNSNRHERLVRISLHKKIFSEEPRVRKNRIASNDNDKKYHHETTTLSNTKPLLFSKRIPNSKTDTPTMQLDCKLDNRHIHMGISNDPFPERWPLGFRYVVNCAWRLWWHTTSLFMWRIWWRYRRLHRASCPCSIR